MAEELRHTIKLENVWKRYRIQDWVLKGITASFSEGESIVIVGSNGSGKTTLIKIIAGLIRPSKGIVEVMGFKPTNAKARKMLGVVLDHMLLYNDLTLRENLKYYSKLYGMEDLNIEEHWAIDLLGLTRHLDRRVAELSFGWKRRADLARALIHNPKIILIDEFYTGLDNEGVKAFAEALNYLRSKSKATTIVVTPQKPQGELLGNQLLFWLRDGRLTRED